MVRDVTDELHRSLSDTGIGTDTLSFPSLKLCFQSPLEIK